MSVLYINTRGEAHRKHSYSASLDYAQSPYKYYLRRILGYRERDDKGAFLFGRALETAIQWHHDNQGQGAVEKFTELWVVHKDKAEVVYTKTEKDWASLQKAGTEMVRLYIIKQPVLPIPLGGSSVFQREYSKFVFEGDEKYGDLEFGGKIDVISYVEPDHPMLPKVNWKPEYGMMRSVLTDIKTSGIDLAEQPGLAAFDKQLRCYAWLTGIHTCALLWFKKASHSLSKGSSVTLLVDKGNFKAGNEAVIAQVTEEGVWLVVNDFMLEEMHTAQGRKEDGSIDQTKAAKQRKMEWLAQNGVLVSESDVTRQRLQFNCGFITKESANEMGQLMGRQMLEIARAWETKFYPSNFGVRFPHNDLKDPYFRAFVLKDEGFKNDNFKQIDNFDEMFEDDSEEDE